MTVRSDASARSRILFASATSIAIRAWQKTCLPASSAAMVSLLCMYGCVPIHIASIFGSDSISSVLA